MHQIPFPTFGFHASRPLELVYSNVWGPAPITFINDFQYYVLFVDAYSKFTWLYLLKHKSNVLDVFKFFKATVENQLNSKIKTLRSDNGGEFSSNAFNLFYSSHGIIHQFSCPHKPQQNRVAERKHRHVVECAFTLLSHLKLPQSYWSYAVSTAVHFINRLPTPNLHNQSPQKVLFLSKPYITHLRTFGYVCFPLLRPYNTHKLQPHTTPCIFLGYPALTKGYICKDPITSRIYISRHFLFNEAKFYPFRSLPTSPTSPPTSQIPIPTLISTSQSCSFPTSQFGTQSSSLSPSFPESASTPQSTPLSLPSPPITQSSPNSGSVSPLSVPSLSACPQVPVPAPSYTHPMITRSKDGIFKPKALATQLTHDQSLSGHFASAVSLVKAAKSTKTTSVSKIDYTITEPPSYRIAAQYPQWCSAMDDEFATLQRQGTWSLVPPSPSQNLVGCK